MAARRRVAGRERAAGARPVASGFAGSNAIVDLVRALGCVLDELSLSEVEVTWAGTTLRVQRSLSPGTVVTPVAPTASSTVSREPAPTSLVSIDAPMVGTFYRASSPTAEPYVREEDVVKQGQILCIIEAMKLMNEIESKVSGRVVKILVDNGQPVEYGQALFLVDPLR